MTFKTCQVINDNFKLDEKFVPYIVGPNNAKVVITDGLDKGYIYACLYFYDEVKKETNKLEKMIRKTYDEVTVDVAQADPAVYMLEVSNRVKEVIGNDGLDALIKQILAERGRHISLIPDKQEIDKYQKICDAILTELMTNFYETTITKAADNGGFRTVTISQKYLDTMTERQRRLLAPAMRMVAFLNDARLDEFKISPDFTITFTPARLNNPFAPQEEKIKESLKKIMEKNQQT